MKSTLATLPLLSLLAFSSSCTEKARSGSFSVTKKIEKPASSASETDTPSEGAVKERAGEEKSSGAVKNVKLMATVENGSTCLDPNLNLVPTSVSLTLCNGSLAQGKASASGETVSETSLCSFSGQTDCKTSSAFQAVDMSSIDATKLLSGFSVNGVFGAAVEAPADCSASGETDCVTVTNFPAAEKDEIAYLDLKANILSHWSFDETSAGVSAVVREDSSPNAYDLLDSNNVASTIGLQGQAANLNNAETQYFQAPQANFDMTGKDLSISFWFRRNSGAGYQDVLSHWDNDNSNTASFYIGLLNDTVIFSFSTSGDPNDGSTSTEIFTEDILDGVWYHVAATYDQSAGTAALYLNGALQAADSSTAPNMSIFFSSSTPVFIGRAIASGDEFNGNLDELSVWKGRALSERSVQRLYNGGTPRVYSSF